MVCNERGERKLGGGQGEAYIPGQAFSKAMPLAGLSAVLVDGVEREGTQPQRLWHPLHKIRVSVAK